MPTADYHNDSIGINSPLPIRKIQCHACEAWMTRRGEDSISSDNKPPFFHPTCIRKRNKAGDTPRDIYNRQQRKGR